MANLEETLMGYNFKIVFGATVLLLLLAAVALRIKKPKKLTKKILFIGIVLATIVPTLYLIISTVYLNSISSSKGPVHWHADFEIWACGTEIDLQDPKGLSNKIGTPVLHEHNDKRIHLEGVVIKPEDASLGRFFQVIGGELTAISLTVPVNNGKQTMKNGDICQTGERGEVQVFVYQTDKDNYYSQRKLANPEQYIIAPDSQVPDGDCVIVEFGPPKLRTDKLCRSYKVAEQIGKIRNSNIEIRNNIK